MRADIDQHEAVIARVEHSNAFGSVGREYHLAVVRESGSREFVTTREAAQVAQVHRCAGRADVHQLEAVIARVEHPHGVCIKGCKYNLAVACSRGSME